MCEILILGTHTMSIRFCLKTRYDTSDVAQVLRSRSGCQYFARQVHTLAQALQTISITWPFTVWGLDLLGPFKKAPRGSTHLLVTVDKFTKWVKVKYLAKFGTKQAIDFIQDNIF
jgi:hypothetical protein